MSRGKDREEIERLRERVACLEARGVLLTREEAQGLVTTLESDHAWGDVVSRRAQAAWDRLRAFVDERGGR